MQSFEFYMLIVNVLGFILYVIKMLINSNEWKKRLDKILIIFSLFGASAGILVAILLFDRKAEKEKLMSWVFVFCVFIIQLIILLTLKGQISDTLRFDIWTIFTENSMLLFYFVIINLISFSAFGLDKLKALRHSSRISIVTLLFLAFIGGAVGELLAMYVFHHKTKKDYFVVGLPLILIMQLVLAFYVLNFNWQAY